MTGVILSPKLLGCQVIGAGVISGGRADLTDGFFWGSRAPAGARVELLSGLDKLFIKKFVRPQVPAGTWARTCLRFDRSCISFL